MGMEAYQSRKDLEKTTYNVLYKIYVQVKQFFVVCSDEVDVEVSLDFLENSELIRDAQGYRRRKWVWCIVAYQAPPTSQYRLKMFLMILMETGTLSMQKRSPRLSHLDLSLLRK